MSRKKKKPKEPCILFVEPFFVHLLEKDKLTNTAAIPFLRGFLHCKNIATSLLNLNRIINSHKSHKKILKKYETQLFLVNRELLMRQGYSETAREDMLNSFLNQPVLHLLSHNPKEIWSAIDKIDCFDEIIKSSLPSLDNVKYIGISITFSTQIIFSFVLIRFFHKNFPGIKIILGGISISGEYKDYLNLLKDKSMVDFLVVGEGETPLFLLINGETKYKNIPNLVYRQNNAYLFSKNYHHAEIINDLPAPYYEPGDAVFIQATRRCYWGKCAYCRFNQIKFSLNGTRYPNKVINDIRSVNNSLKKFRMITFCDSTLPSQFIKDFSVLVIKDKLKNLRFQANLRCDNYLDEETISLAAKAGFSSFFVGVETSLTRLRHIIGKGSDYGKILEIIDLCCINDIHLVLSYMIGLPTQTKEELLVDLNEIKRLSVKYQKKLSFFLFSLVVFRGTEIYRNPEKFKLRIFKNYRNLFSYGIVHKQENKNAISVEEAYNISINFINKNKKYLPTTKIISKGISPSLEVD